MVAIAADPHGASPTIVSGEHNVSDPGSSSDGEERFSQRYGARSTSGYRRRLVVITVAVVILAAWAVWAGWSQSRPDIHGRLHSFEVVSPHKITVRIDVFRPGSSAIACSVVARAVDHRPVGEEEWRLPAGDSGTHPLSGTIKTSREATSANVEGCRSVG